MDTNNCTWPANDSLMIDYHNNEWGVPLHDDKKLFEFLVLDAFQAGLSWKTILHKRENFRLLFDGFDPEKIALFDENKVQQLLLDSSIIRNQSKIRATISNAQSFLNIQKEFGSFDRYIWQFSNDKTIIDYSKSNAEIACNSAESDAMSKDLIKRGFKFVGSTICYAFMQAAGMVNDHLEGCSCK